MPRSLVPFAGGGLVAWASHVTVIACLVSFSPKAFAQACPIGQDASPLLADQSGAERLGYLESRLPRAERRAQTWFWGWTSTYSALAVGQAIVVPLSDDPKSRRTLSINAASAALGVIFAVATPPRLMGLRSRLEREKRKSGDTCAALAFAERQLERAARRERFGKSWLLHGGNVLFNTSVGLVLGLTWGYWRYAFLTRMAGIFLGEVMIWTKPTDATRILEDYEKGLWIHQPALQGRPSAQLSLRPWFFPRGGGLSLKLTL